MLFAILTQATDVTSNMIGGLAVVLVVVVVVVIATVLLIRRG